MQWEGCRAPHIVPAVRNGAHAAAQAFTAEEREGLGQTSTLAIATAGTSPLVYLADQLTKRADTLRNHGKFVSTMPACAAAADLMRHLDTIPDTGDTSTAADATPAPFAEQRFAAAAAAAAAENAAAAPAAGGPSSNGSAAAAAPNAPSNSSASKPPSVARSYEVPMDACGPLALAHEPNMSRFVDYALLREMPAAAGPALEEVTAQAARGPAIAALMPRPLDPPMWAPPRPQAVDAKPTAPRKRAATPPGTRDTKPDVKPPAHGGMHAGAGDAGPMKLPVGTGAPGGTHGVHASDELMGGGSADAKPKADIGDLYSDLMTGGKHAPKASGRSGTVRTPRNASKLRNPRCMHVHIFHPPRASISDKL